MTLRRMCNKSKKDIIKNEIIRPIFRWQNKEINSSDM